MGWLLKAAVLPLVRWVRWQGRSGAVLPCVRETQPLLLMGVHGSHDLETLRDDLTALSCLRASAPREASVLIAGDWNVDRRCEFEPEPAAGAGWLRAARRRVLGEWAAGALARVRLPDVVMSLPGGPQNDDCLMMPLTWLPQGAVAAAQRGSILDYVVAAATVECEVAVAWEGAPADHAFLMWSTKFVARRQRAARRKWIPSEWADVEEAATHHVAVRVLEDSARALQAETWDRRTCAERRAARVPTQSRFRYRAAAQARTEPERRRLRDEARRILCAHIRSMRRGRLVQHVRAGRTFSRGKALRPPLAMRTAPEATIDDSQAMVSAAAMWFSAKWKVASPHWLEHVRSLMHTRESHALHQPLEVAEAWPRLARRGLADARGVSANALRALFEASPASFAPCIAALCASSELMGQMGVHRAVWGKRTARPCLSELRAVVPQSSLLSIVDIVVSHRLHAWISEHLLVPPGMYVGGVHGSQLLEMSHGLSLFIERALDSASQGSVAQVDVEQYDDTVDPALFVRRLLRWGCPAPLACAALRHQLLPSVTLSLGGRPGSEAVVRDRTAGCLTGSRVVVALGRVPLHAALRARAAVWSRLSGVDVGPSSLSVAVYVDNIFIVARSARRACDIAADLEAELAREWRLRIKPSKSEF